MKALLLTQISAAVGALVMGTAASAWAQTKTTEPARQPNILVIMADDIGPSNVGLYSHGMMVPTPNIDRIGREGMLFTDHYAQPSSTPGPARWPDRPGRTRPHLGRGAQGAGLQDRPVWQEPSG